MAKTAAERKREQRERDKQTEEERRARLLSRRIQIDLYKNTDAALIQLMSSVSIDEEQDLITRLIHGAARLHAQDLEALVRRP